MNLRDDVLGLELLIMHNLTILYVFFSGQTFMHKFFGIFVIVMLYYYYLINFSLFRFRRTLHYCRAQTESN